MSLVTLLSAVLSVAAAAETKGVVDFERDVFPILEQNCFECHGSESREGGLRFTNRVDALELNDSGKPAIVPNNVAASELIARVTSDDTEIAMPPDGKRLSTTQVATLKRWIEGGADWPTSASSLSRHWAYVAPERPQRPIVADSSWPRNDIDYFVLSRMEEEALSPSPVAPRERLLRRVYLDLIGLPPSIEQLDSFLADSSDGAFERVVDQLLASSRFGEKWARGWLDLARYSDSNGYQADQIRQMWAYRDWVIDALNSDMPYDQFTIEQLAGDLLPNATHSQKTATGFHRATTCNVEAGVDPEGNRTDQVIDRVNTTATVWLGTTLACAQCHNHKYDPFSQKEYYQVFSFFNNTPMEVEKNDDNPNNVQFNFWGPKLKLPMATARLEEMESVSAKLNAARDSLQSAESSVVAQLAEWEDALSDEQRDRLPELVKEAIETNLPDRSKAQRQEIEKHAKSLNPQVKELRVAVNKLQKRLDKLAPDTTLVMVEMPNHRQTNIFVRGDFLNRGPVVEADVPAALHAFPETLPRNRLGFAKWLASRQNPLVARVAVNRWWAEIFGSGLVRTAEDFGVKGDSPSHPQLLDWLAVEFMEKNWSMKHILKQIVMSATYRQDSTVTDGRFRTDPYNRWLSYGPRVRLPAESIRDNALFICGLLSHGRGGAPVFPPQPDGIWHQTGRNEPVYKVASDERRYRRGVYVVWRRAAPYPSFVNFDAPDRMSCTVRRAKTNTPLQALTLMNDEAYVEAAVALGAIIAMHDAPTSDEKVAFAFQRCLARSPNLEELAVVRDIFTHELNRLQTQPEVSKEIIGAFQLPAGIARPADVNSWAAWFCVANVLLNLDETITKN